MRLLPVGYTNAIMLKVFLSTDHVTLATGKTVAIIISKNGGAFGNPSAGATNATEVANGWYTFTPSATDTGTVGDLVIRGTCTGCDDAEQICQVANANNAGFAALPNAAAGANGGLPTVDANNAVKVQSNIKKNTALANFNFVMTDSTTHAPKTGLTVTAQCSLDGAAFGSCANSVSELSNGAYLINLAATDLNANTVMLRFSATGADDLDILILTQP